jgi:hypothetical protein
MENILRYMGVFWNLIVVWICLIIALTRALQLPSPVVQLRSFLLGQFDNSEQAQISMTNGIRTAREGGHEMVTALIKENERDPSYLVATYFLDNDVNQTFRYRFYKLEAVDGNDLSTKRICARMSIYRPLKPTLERLRACKFDPALYLPTLEEMEYLPACDMGCHWREEQLEQEGKAVDHKGAHFVGELLGDGDLVSEADPSRRIQVYDSLELGPTALLINDRVYDSETGEQLIGNIHGIPYEMMRR